jgi:hypothetical protein
MRRFAYRQPHIGSISSIIARSTACLSTSTRRPHSTITGCTSAATAAPDAVAGLVTAALTSPQHPLEQVFRATSTDAAPSSAPPSSSGSTARVVLRTGYRGPAAKAPANAAHDVPPSAASFEVIDTAAFEQLLVDALLVIPVVEEEAGAVSSSSSASGVAATPTTVLTNHTVRELQALLSAAEKALRKPAARKAEIDRYVYGGYLPLLKYGTFALLSLQFAVYFNWIFFVFDWNLVEPTTYFLGYTGVFCSLVYHYYRCGADDFTWHNLFQHMAHKEAAKMYGKKKVDAAAVAQLQRLVADIKAELGRAAA